MGEGKELEILNLGRDPLMLCRMDKLKVFSEILTCVVWNCVMVVKSWNSVWESILGYGVVLELCTKFMQQWNGMDIISNIPIYGVKLIWDEESRN